jgi:hypothetical protein
LVINQLIGLYECKYDVLKGYYDECRKLLEDFSLTSLQHIPRAQNQEANWLAQNASGYRLVQEILSSETLANDWRMEIADYLMNPSQKVTRKLRYKSTKYVLLDDQLYYKTVKGVLLRCLNQEAKVLMREVHEGICGARQSAYKMKWIICRSGYFWPMILEVCFEYYKGC